MKDARRTRNERGGTRACRAGREPRRTWQIALLRRTPACSCFCIVNASRLLERAGGTCMRIAQVAPLYESVPPRTYGGTERVVSYLTEELVELGHDVTLFAS